MPTNEKIQSNISSMEKIYTEESGTLASRIDIAWNVYCNDTDYTLSLRKEAEQFLFYAFDLNEISEINNDKLIQLMAERDLYKSDNPDYIPGQSPKHLLLSVKKMSPEKIELDMPACDQDIKMAIDQKELLDVHREKKIQDESSPPLLLNANERAKYRVHLSGGLFKKNEKYFDTTQDSSHGKKGFAACTLNINGEFSVFPHGYLNKKDELFNKNKTVQKDKLVHSSMNAGAPVVFAGECKIEKGKLKTITTHSGHYDPTLFNVYRLLDHFKQHKIDISDLEILTFQEPSSKLEGITSSMIEAINGTQDNKQPHLLYQTKADDIHKAIDSLLVENIDTIKTWLENYKKTDVRKSFLYIKDLITCGTLTKDRVMLAKIAVELLEQFEADLKAGKGKADLNRTIEKVDELISQCELANKTFSKLSGKTEDSGQLASNLKAFKARLEEAKTSVSTTVTIMKTLQ